TVSPWTWSSACTSSSATRWCSTPRRRPTERTNARLPFKRRRMMATSADDMTRGLTFRAFRDGDNEWPSMHDKIFNADHSHKCPVYVHRTPPCQGSCPSGEDVRGWLQIVRGIEKAPEGMSMEEYAFRRLTDANPFPAMMGRRCPAPCEIDRKSVVQGITAVPGNTP